MNEFHIFAAIETIVLIVVAYLWIKAESENHRLRKLASKSFSKGFRIGIIKKRIKGFNDGFKSCLAHVKDLRRK